ncbi:MAG: hypothetical protein CME88_16410 [Hirschia sp.]|nr:hypothetical protein [Hirschia sp.]MBF19960.1 hypothetical protein [Hirschia sp.]|tara:strand:- start:935 stop:1213 length:279 start_codon:yes stop_codon:yes gene_type:complete
MSRRPTDPPETAILKDAHIDDVARGLLALAREVWVLTDRVMIMEALLEDRGVSSGMIDNFQPDEKLELELKKRREAMLGRLMTAMGAEGLNT